MKICPIAIAVGCKKCPLFKICPVKTLLGDAPKATEVKPAASKVTRIRTRAAAKPGVARKRTKK